MDPKQALFVGLGWLERSQERIEELIEELVERGELKRKDSKRFIRQIMEQARGEREEFRKIVQEMLRDAIGLAGVATIEDLNELGARLDIVEKKLRKSRPAPAAKPAKAAVKKAVKPKAGATKKSAPKTKKG